MSVAAATKRAGNVVRFESKRQQALFTWRDLLDLNAWDSSGRRVEVDRSEDLDGLGQFALVFRGNEPWATWAISREGARVLLWDCITLADIGRFDCMRQALAAIPNASAEAVPRAASAEVIPFAALLARRSAA